MIKSSLRPFLTLQWRMFLSYQISFLCMCELNSAHCSKGACITTQWRSGWNQAESRKKRMVDSNYLLDSGINSSIVHTNFCLYVTFKCALHTQLNHAHDL